MSLKTRGILLVLSLIFFLAPWWTPHFEQVAGHNMFITGDSIFFLGLAIFVGLISQWLLPQSLLDGTDRLFGFVRSKFIFFAISFLLLVLCALYWVNQNILHSFMNSADEHSCYFLAESIRMGKWWVEPHPLSEFFNVVHVGNRDGKWFSVYPPGWPLVWALGLQFNIVDWLNPILATLSLIFFYKAAKKIFGMSSAWFGIFCLVITPYFAFTSASYFSHGTCLFMVALFVYAFLKWMESSQESKRILWAVIAAFACGYGLNTRYLTMAAIAAPFILYRLFRILMRKEKVDKADFIFSGILILSFAFALYNNYMVSGKPFKAPNRYDKGWERLGFRGGYSVVEGLFYIVARLFYLIDWVPPMFVVLFFASLFQKRSFEFYGQLFRWGFFYLVFAYFLYYSWGGNQFGPRYYFEGVPFLMLAMADGLRYWWKEGVPALKKFLLGVVIVSLGTAGYQFYEQGSFYEVASAQRKALYVLAEQTINKPSIVFIKGFLGDKLVMSQDDAIRNSPRLDGIILYARDIPEKNQLLREFYPDREYYLGYFDRTSKEAKLEKMT